MYGIHVMIHYGIAFETKATIWALLAWRTVTEVSGDWCPTESIEQTPMKIKKQTCCLLKYGPRKNKPQLPVHGSYF